MTDAHGLRVAEEVRALMARRRVSQQTLATALGVSQAAVSRRTTGLVPFSVSQLCVVAEVLEVPVDTLIGTAPAAVPA